MMRNELPIAYDDFREVREDYSFYYVDKSLLIKDFIEHKNKVALITRPRRFGKTLNMSMIREFFDITKDSKAIFNELAIMDTEYAGLINTIPVIFLTFKNCNANDENSLKFTISDTVYEEYERYHGIFADYMNKTSGRYKRFMMTYDMLLDGNISWDFLSISIVTLEKIVTEYFGIKPILLIDEYDQPILSSYENNYHHNLKDFFSNFYGGALKGQAGMSRALLTGIQRVAKESIFSKLNNVTVYTVLDKTYSPYFGLNTDETENLLKHFGYELNDNVKNQYDGYVFSGIHMYNPWSVLNYADTGELLPYWINTSTNYLVKESLSKADFSFQDKFNQLIINENVNVNITLETSFIELENNSTLWGLLVNSGYITIVERLDGEFMKVKIPNDEVNSEFQKIVAEQANIQNDDLKEMLNYLLHMELEGFMSIYRKIVLCCTSHFDAKENAYHMLFLGMCIALRGMYKITSNIESGHGRKEPSSCEDAPDITMESLSKNRFHIIIEFKQGDDIDRLKKEAINQIMEKQYYTGLTGQVLCIGIAHNVKYCEMEYKTINVK